MKNLETFLRDAEVAPGLIGVFMTLASSVKKISEAIAFADTGKAGSSNSFGEDQLKLDVLSDKIIEDDARMNIDIGLIASEEREDELKISEGVYAVCYDPLDGSSLVDSNLAVGSIFGIYEARTFIGLKGSDQVGAMFAVYGPRTSIVLTCLQGVQEFVLNAEGEFVLAQPKMEVGEGKMFAPGNLRACTERNDYLELVNYWIKNGYTLRYSGGMVPDINQILVKGMGIFTYPGYGEAPEGKLRMLFECAPFALIMEQAGGACSDGKMRLLDREVLEIAQRTPIFVGSKAEVERAASFLKA